MGRVAQPAALLLAVAIIAGCGGKSPSPARTAAAAGQGPKASAVSKTLPWGQPGIALGDSGNRLRITPLGVLYTRGPYKKLPGTDAQNGWFVVIALRAEALDAADTIPAPLSGGGFWWNGAEQRLNTISGNGANPPWAGSVSVFGSNLPIQPGDPQVGIEDFDVPVKTAAKLLYVDPASHSVVSWELPAADQGTGLDSVRKILSQAS